MASCEEDLVSHLGRTARKRALVSSEWAKNKDKHRSDGSIPKVAWNHNDGFCKTSELSTTDCFHSLFYNNKTKVESDSFLSKLGIIQHNHAMPFWQKVFSNSAADVVNDSSDNEL
ncbi:hypothetical protein L9F63_003083 [Diploptera punctata]|uniref:Uncharacterized protein n=1 Tax=Diploptera punctata TaxID=6984 RepID=A0AAD8ECL8_DIPPU|nr:hypothetical protein L9F63_003083 [Diploptera punctata]